MDRLSCFQTRRKTSTTAASSPFRYDFRALFIINIASSTHANNIQLIVRRANRRNVESFHRLREIYRVDFLQTQSRHHRRRAVLSATVRRRRRSNRVAPVCCIRITRGCTCIICTTTTITRAQRARRHRTGHPWTKISHLRPRVRPARLPAACDRCRARRSPRCIPRTEDAAAGNSSRAQVEPLRMHSTLSLCSNGMESEKPTASLEIYLC